MAFTANTDQRYAHQNLSTLREDVSDQVALMSPVDTPLLSMLEHVEVGNRNYEWTMDEIDFDKTSSTIASFPVREGADAFGNTDLSDTLVRPRIGNYAQINRVDFDITGNMRAENTIGTSDEFDYQSHNKLLQLAKMMEYAAHYGQARESAETTQSAGNTRLTEGIVSWIAETGNQRRVGSGATTNAGDGSSIPFNFQSNFVDGGNVNLTRDFFIDDVLAPAWKEGLNVGGSIMLCGSKIKTLVSEFSLFSGAASINERTIPADMKMFVDTIDVVDTHFGKVFVNLDRYMDVSGQSMTTANNSGGDAYTVPFDDVFIVIDRDYWKISTVRGRGIGFYPLATVGDSTKAMYLADWGTICQNPLAGCGAHKVVA